MHDFHRSEDVNAVARTPEGLRRIDQGQDDEYLSCANISTADLILRRLESYEGVNKVEPITITSESRVYRDWLKSEIDKRIVDSQKHSSSSAYATTTTTTITPTTITED